MTRYFAEIGTLAQAAVVQDEYFGNEPGTTTEQDMVNGCYSEDDYDDALFVLSYDTHSVVDADMTDAGTCNVGYIISSHGETRLHTADVNVYTYDGKLYVDIDEYEDCF